ANASRTFAMVMPRLSWPLLAAGLLLLPPQPQSTEPVNRAGLVPDPSFELADSVRAILSGVVRLVVAPDSSLYLLDWRIPAVLHLDHSGAFRQAIGRQGSGPGEFAQVYSIGLHGDSLWAGDAAQVRMTLFDRKGPGVHTVPFGRSAPRQAAAGAYSVRGLPFGIFPDGSLLLEESTPDPERPTHGLLLRADRTMRVLDTIATLPGERQAMSFRLVDGAVLIPEPFSDSPLYGVSADGSLLVLVNRRAATSTSDAELTVMGLRNGTTRVFTRTIGYTPRRLGSRQIDSAAAMFAGDASGGVPADTIRRRMFKPAYLPPVTEVRVGRDGTVWLKVQFGDGPADADEYMQLSPRGLPQRRVVTPRGFRLLEADRRSVWGTVTDSLDVPEVRRYTFNQAAMR
ncbi:MAG TPA: 6-bladed beta-propeller, partial [Gemmatimonadales bacterium]|nr:6-bladed beta-propeller [Gemmatimonadales bacterium]